MDIIAHSFGIMQGRHGLGEVFGPFSIVLGVLWMYPVYPVHQPWQGWTVFKIDCISWVLIVLNPDDVLLVLIFTFARKTGRLCGLYGLHGPRCSPSPKRPLNLVTHSLCEIVYISMAKHIEAETRWLPFPDDIVKWISLKKKSMNIDWNFIEFCS